MPFLTQCSEWHLFLCSVTMLHCYNVTMLHYPVIQSEAKDLGNIHVDAHEIFRATPQQLVFVTTFL